MSWREVPGFPHYEASPDGQIRRKNGKILAQATLKGTGYKKVCLCENGKPVQMHVHRVIAQTFLLNPENKPAVNHRDFDRTNNRAENLEWCTYRENNEFSLIHQPPVRNSSRGDLRHIYRRRKNWCVQIRHKYYGTFPTLEEAKRRRDQICRDLGFIDSAGTIAGSAADRQPTCITSFMAQD